MRKMLVILITSSLILYSCTENRSKKNVEHATKKIVAGNIILADSVRITQDELNEQYYSVKVITTDSSNEGYYTIQASYGHNLGNGLMALPNLKEPLKPAMIKNPDLDYCYIIGFTKPSEGHKIFHDYFEVKAHRNANEMRYIKSYYYETAK